MFLKLQTTFRTEERNDPLKKHFSILNSYHILILQVYYWYVLHPVASVYWYFLDHFSEFSYHFFSNSKDKILDNVTFLLHSEIV